MAPLFSEKIYELSVEAEEHELKQRREKAQLESSLHEEKRRRRLAETDLEEAKEKIAALEAEVEHTLLRPDGHAGRLVHHRERCLS